MSATGIIIDDPRIERLLDHVRLIRQSWQRAVESIVEVGKLLIAAKASLDHGEWGVMFGQGLMPFGRATARMLMAIAKHQIVSDRAYRRHLPTSWRTLYELTRLPDDVLLRGMRNGTVSPQMERREVEMLRQRQRLNNPRRRRGHLLTVTTP